MAPSMHPDGDKYFSTLSSGVEHFMPVDSASGRHVAKDTGVRACHFESGAGFRVPDLILCADDRRRT